MVERTVFKGIDAVTLTNGKDDKLDILTGVGPRIISFRPEGGDNFFYVNEQNLEGYTQNKNEWYVYGGTRLWVSPEAPITYAPDNSPVRVDTAESGVTLTTSDAATGLKKVIEVQAMDRTFDLTFTIINEGHLILSAGLWVLSCLEPSGDARIFLPWGEEGEWNVKDMKYWRSWLDAGSNIESKQWQPTNEFFIVTPSGETGKIGFRNRHGFALFQRGELSFIKRAPYFEGALYPDDGCSLEVYTSKDFYEIESLSPLYSLKPGIAYSHREQWWAGYDEVDTASIDSVKAFTEELFT
jgi:hypothetical protein